LSSSGGRRITSSGSRSGATPELWGCHLEVLLQGTRGLGFPSGHWRAPQKIIERVEEITGRELITYIANPFDPLPHMVPQDAVLFEDVLRTCEGSRGDLLIDSPGGDPHTAERLLRMLRKKFREEFNVIVVHKAKSAATMVAIGADKIVMSPTAELGPIDPQLVIPTQRGGYPIPARAYLNGLDEIVERVVKEGHPVELYLPMLVNVRPEILDMAAKVIEYSREFAKAWLGLGAMRGRSEEEIRQVAKELVDGYTFERDGLARANVSKAEEILEREGMEVRLEDRVREVDEIIGKPLQAAQRLGARESAHSAGR